MVGSSEIIRSSPLRIPIDSIGRAASDGKINCLQQCVIGWLAGENGDISWFKDHKDPEVDAFVVNKTSGGVVLLFGRVTFELMESYRPTQHAMEMTDITPAIVITAAASTRRKRALPFLISLLTQAGWLWSTMAR
jgi:hypothetical protein